MQPVSSWREDEVTLGLKLEKKIHFQKDTFSFKIKWYLEVNVGPFVQQCFSTFLTVLNHTVVQRTFTLQKVLVRGPRVHAPCSVFCDMLFTMHYKFALKCINYSRHRAPSCFLTFCNYYKVGISFFLNDLNTM